MKKFFTVFLSFFVFSTLLYPQKISILKLQQITDKSQGEFYYPKLSPDGSKLFFTSANFTGLWYYDLNSKGITQVSKDNGAGYRFNFAGNGSSVIFRVSRYDDNGLRTSQSIVQKDLVSMDEKVLGTGEDLSSPEVLSDQKVVFTSGDKLIVNSALSDAALNKSASVQRVTEPVAYIEHQKIALFMNGDKKILSPLGEGNYIWPSVSPDGTKLLFTFAGKGTFVSDLEGNVLFSLGYADAPSWSPDSKWIVFMNDKDNGQSVTSSDIYAYSLANQKKFQLTDTKDIHEMYPEWSSDGQKIVFNSEDGKVFLMELIAE